MKQELLTKFELLSEEQQQSLLSVLTFTLFLNSKNIPQSKSPNKSTKLPTGAKLDKQFLTSIASIVEV